MITHAFAPCATSRLTKPLPWLQEQRSHCDRSHRPSPQLRHRRTLTVRGCAKIPRQTAYTNSLGTAATRISRSFTKLFPVWTVISALLALLYPSLFTSLTNPLTIQRWLSVLMLSTGLTLTLPELAAAARRPVPLMFCFFACYGFMPALGIFLAKLFALSTSHAAGLILLGIISGGQASNLCTYIAGGDTALSVAMTTLTTVTSVATLPLLSGALLGTVLGVDRIALVKSTTEIVLVPIIVGAVANQLLPSATVRVKPVLPVLGIVAVLILIVGPVAQTASLVGSAFQELVVPVVLLHVGGGMFGYLVPRLFGADRKTAVTMGFETGFKSPALSFVLAGRHFGEGVGLASVVSIVVLAPLAALFAVGFGIAGGRKRKAAVMTERAEWKVQMGEQGVRRENARALFYVKRRNGQGSLVGYDRLGAELERARRNGGICGVERVVMDEGGVVEGVGQGCAGDESG